MGTTGSASGHDEILATMRALADDIASGRREPPASDDMHELARAALNAEYAPRGP